MLSQPYFSLPLLILSLLITHSSSLLYFQENTFDFIIVGGGTAGLVVARRLAEYKRFSVLVLESGSHPKKDSDIPAFAPKFLGDPDVTFRYNSVPQKNAGLRNDGIISLIAGKMLSGTSNLNYMYFNRGSPKDFDNWGNLTQDASWNYSNMFKYFKRVETYRGDHPSDQHGYKGPITVSRPRFAPGLDIWLEAGRNLCYDIADPIGPQKISFSATEYSKRRGRRVISLYGYINPILGTSPNLQIATNTTATKINAVSTHARKEIIVSAGTYGSLQLLLCSGIGPKDSLIEANIPVIKDLPVGHNFHEHVFVNLPFVLNGEWLIMDNDRDLNPRTLEFYKYVGDGPYSSTLGSGGEAFLASSVAKSEGEEDWPDLQLVVAPNKQAFFATGLVGNESAKSVEGPMRATVMTNRPKSRGSLKLNPRDPDGPPIIDPGLLSDPRDLQKMLDGIEEMMRIFEETPAYQRVGARFPEQLNLPGCDEFEFRSKPFWECFIRYTSSAGCHAVGTCRMGLKEDDNAVVDSTLRVIDIDGLRVVDASIMPTVTNANTQAPVYGIAEKASEMILQDWGYY